eukprot:TRINITY_DN20975_c0_g1_i1.p1 TRINITY_DN20975_c0_g1~~TRINITY_DN20975_c0_g1_i1.p1  ORF type:complete len:482 (+),score=108.30 TRINITY_DN20975_c0_g1_i1:979-2424(+)
MPHANTTADTFTHNMFAILAVAVVASGTNDTEEDVGVFTDGCGGRIDSKLRWQAYCARRFDLTEDVQARQFCDMETGMNTEPWGYRNLSAMMQSLLRENPAAECPMEEEQEMSLDHNQTKGYQTSPTCTVHRFERDYWASKPDLANTSIVLHNKQNKKECWDILPPSTLTGCTHRVDRCLNSTSIIDHECKNETAANRLHIRQLGKTCPTLKQLKHAFEPLIVKNKDFKEEILRDFLGKFTVVIGDSITRGTGAYRYHKKRANGWGIRLYWGAKNWGEEALGLRKGDTCLVAKDGLSTHKLKLEMAGKGISKHYYVTNAPKKAIHKCFKDTRSDRIPRTAILNMGANDFLDNTNIFAYEQNLKWLVGKMQHWSRGALRGLILAIHPFPASGKREFPNGKGVYDWRSAVVNTVHAVADWTRTTYNEVHKKGNRSYDWVTVYNANVPLSWCAEYNFADGIHPNARGHYLLAVDFMRTLLKPQN